ncbi:MAG: hypothetical protein RIR24_121 [Actinomycetota bacterium]|jgi:hypothetical protein
MRFQIFGLIVLIIFTVFVTVFAASADRNAVRVLPKYVWVLLCLFITPIGGFLYLTFGRPLGGPGRRQRSKPAAPDDDPQFLRDLSERLRKDDEGKE